MSIKVVSEQIDIRLGSLWMGASTDLWMVMKIDTTNYAITFRRLNHPHMSMVAPYNVVHNLFYCVSE